MKSFPNELLSRPFTRARARDLGVSEAMFKGRRFVRVFPRVWRHRGHEMTPADWIMAGRLALPVDAKLTGISRVQQLGLDHGPAFPLHFVVEGDLHLTIPGIFLHRTIGLAPYADGDVSPAAAFISYCSHARVIDAIMVGDWLLHRRHMTADELAALALSGIWRDGADEALWILEHLDGRARSIRESELRSVLDFSGLPKPLVNHPVDLGDDAMAIGDLVYQPQGPVVEYEGGHHQTDRRQYSADLDRYALFRSHGVPYVQVTHERLATPKILVGTVFRELVRLGYGGPAPVFEERWRQLFRPIRDVLGSRHDRLRLRARAAAGPAPLH